MSGYWLFWLRLLMVFLTLSSEYQDSAFKYAITARPYLLTLHIFLSHMMQLNRTVKQPSNQ